MMNGGDRVPGDEEPQNSITLACMRKAHPVEVTLDMVGLNSKGSAFKVRCPEDNCGSPVPISKDKVADLMGLKKEDRANVLELFMARYPAKAAEAKTGATDVTTDDETGSEDDSGMTDNGSDQDVLGEDDDSQPTREEEIYAPLPSRQPASAAPVRKAAPVRAAPPQRSRPPMGVQERSQSSVLIEDENTDLTPRDILIAVIDASGLPPTEVRQLIEWVNLTQDDTWDPFSAEGLFKRFGLTSTVVARLTSRYRNQLELHRMRKQRNEELTNYVVGKGNRPGMPGMGMSGMDPYSAAAGHQMSSDGGRNMMQQTQQAQDPCAAAIQAIIQAANGVITPQVLQAMDAVRQAYGRAGPAMPGMMTAGSPADVQNAVQQNQMSMMQMFEKMLEANQKQKQTEEEKAKEKAEIQQRFDEMKNLIMVIATKATTPPPAPANTGSDENKMLLDTLLKMVEKQTTPPPAPAPQVGKSRDEMMFEKLFDMVLEGAKAKPAEAMAPLQQKLDSLEDQISRIGGGFAGLPTNSDQLHGVIDYLKATAEIKKTESEFADKAANRELITTIAQSAFTSIGEAVASTFMQNAGTPAEKSVDLKEQPVDDGSVVNVQCPNCGQPMTAPKNAPLIQCPTCGSKFERVKHELTPEQMAEAEQKVRLALMERRLREQQGADAAAAAPQPPDQQPPASPQAPPRPAPTGKEPGPLSSIVMEEHTRNKAPSPVLGPNAAPQIAPPPPPPSPSPAEQVVGQQSAEQPADVPETPQDGERGSETDLSVTDEHSALEQGQQ